MKHIMEGTNKQTTLNNDFELLSNTEKAKKLVKYILEDTENFVERRALMAEVKRLNKKLSLYTIEKAIYELELEGELVVKKSGKTRYYMLREIYEKKRAEELAKEADELTQ